MWLIKKDNNVRASVNAGDYAGFGRNLIINVTSRLQHMIY